MAASGCSGSRQHESDESCGKSLYGFQNIVVVHTHGFHAFPGEAENHGTIDPLGIHFRDNLLCTGKFGSGGVVEQFKSGLILEIRFPVLSYGFRKNMGMEINNHCSGSGTSLSILKLAQNDVF